MRAGELLTIAERNYGVIRKKYEEAIVVEAGKNLKPGEPCPVCGSIEHPRAVSSENAESAHKIIVDFDAASKKLQEARTHEGITAQKFLKRTRKQFLRRSRRCLK